MMLYVPDGNGRCTDSQLDIIQVQHSSYCEKTYDVDTNSTIYQTTTCSNSNTKSFITNTFFSDSDCKVQASKKATKKPFADFGECYDASLFTSDFAGYAKPICQE